MNLYTEVDTFQSVDFSELQIPLITVYFNPLDLPDKYIARLFDLQTPTNIVVIRDTLEEIRNAIPSSFSKISRMVSDHPSVLEVWL